VIGHTRAAEGGARGLRNGLGDTLLTTSQDVKGGPATVGLICSVVLDGEAVAWSNDKAKTLPFQVCVEGGGVLEGVAPKQLY
jgi:hypothetical protein